MVFFESKNDTLDIAKAKQLFAILKKHKRVITAKVSLRLWAKEIRLLRKQVATAKIEEMLAWLDKNIKQVPYVHSAKSFRYSFHKLEKAYLETSYRQITISDEAHKIKKRNYCQWRKGEEDQELPFIQICLDNFQAFLDQANRAIANLDKKLIPELSNRDTYDKIVIQRLLNLIGPASGLANKWLNDTHRIALTWDGWKGNLLAWVFTPERERWTSFVLSTLSDYLIPEDWPRIKGIIDAS